MHHFFPTSIGEPQNFDHCLMFIPPSGYIPILTFPLIFLSNTVGMHLILLQVAQAQDACHKYHNILLYGCMLYIKFNKSKYKIEGNPIILIRIKYPLPTYQLIVPYETTEFPSGVHLMPSPQNQLIFNIFLLLWVVILTVDEPEIVMVENFYQSLNNMMRLVLSQNEIILRNNTQSRYNKLQ